MSRSGACDGLQATVTLALLRGVGPRLYRQLISQFGSAALALQASLDQLRQVPGVGSELGRRIVSATEQVKAEEELALCRQHDIEVITEQDGGYPRLLREIPDPPGVLFVQGSMLPGDALALAVVGTRHASDYGRRQAERLAGGLAAAGMTIVSGLARGIDAVAHRAALDAGGRTLAVLGSGLLQMYPPEHRSLADRITGSGAVISEFAPRRQPMSTTFPQRNRVITGLSLGVIVVEASHRSGALISARHAMEQGREVFAVPGRVDSRVSRGCHQLLRDGAVLVESVDDVLEALGPLVEAAPLKDGGVVRHPAELQLNEQEQSVLRAIGIEPTGLDQVIRNSGLPAGRVLSTISVLEMRRLIRRLSGQLVTRY